jgi:large subunit ribosomal protein L21
MTPYAIIETGGKQYRAEKGTVLVVDRLSDDEGSKVTLRPVMFSGDDKFVGGGDDLEKVKVEAEVVEHLRGEKIKVFKYKAKKGYRKRRGHRSSLTKLEVKDVKMLTRKPAAAKKETSEAKAETAEKPAAKKPAAKKPAAKKPAAKKPAAKKPAAKKTEEDG